MIRRSLQRQQQPMAAAAASASATRAATPMSSSAAMHTSTTSSVPSSRFESTDAIRTRFSTAMSAMYRTEVPLYDKLMAIVTGVNCGVMGTQPEIKAALVRSGEMHRLDVERHGAIRLGLPKELHTMRRLFGVMGMLPVGYYDLAVAKVPVHATAFRPVTETALAANPFRVFTSLLRLELIADAELRAEAVATLEKREIFTPGTLAFVEQCEKDGGLAAGDADKFVAEALETFRWHSHATVPAELYARLHDSHRLVADVACFRGPHINHLTPRTLDIDAAQASMQMAGIDAKEIIEGPPRRRCPILLRQTSFKALSEPVIFPTTSTSATPAKGASSSSSGGRQGRHTARFGEIEQRGQALTAKGRALYDTLLSEALRLNSNATPATSASSPTVGRDIDGSTAQAASSDRYYETLGRVFEAFPDDLSAIRRLGLGYFRYGLTDAGRAKAVATSSSTLGEGTTSMDALIDAGLVEAEPITYEDFLPVSAAGIFQSNLGSMPTAAPATSPSEGVSAQQQQQQSAFEAALGAPVLPLDDVYTELEQSSKSAVLKALGSEA